MKGIGLGLLLVALWGATPARALAQQVAPPQMELLRENRQMLQLTEEQATRLETIRTSLMQRNEPLIARIVELRRDFQREQRAVRAQGRRQGQPLRQMPSLLGGQRQPTARLEEIRTSVRSLLDQIQANNRAAMVEVNQLLTRPQRARLRELIQTTRPAGRGGAARPGGAGGSGAPAGLGG